MIDGFAAVFRQRLERKIDDAIGQKRLALSSGSCKSMEEYKEHCGYIRALEQVHKMMDETAQGLTTEGQRKT
jgi:hypothetical protein